LFPRVALIGILIIALADARLTAEEILRNVQTNGSSSSMVQFKVFRGGEGTEVTFTGDAVSEETLWVPGTGSVAWRHADSAADTDLRAQRTGDTIRVNGRLKGKEVTRELRIDSAPWYQIFGPGIADLLPSGAKRMEFWVVNPEDLAPHKMLARRAGAERLEVAGTQVDAFKIHFSPAGALAPFWGADFWYRPSDSAYLYSRLPEKGGLTITTVIW
jgi:hypothetical protein